MTRRRELPKTPTGISGLDEILNGGLPTGRPTLMCGSAGCGKTLMAITFLANGALADEPGVLLSFDENARDIAQNTASLGINIDRLVATRKLAIDYVDIDRNALQESGEYDLDGLFIRLDYAVKQVGARRVVLDGIDNLFAGLGNSAIVRSEFRRLLQWLKAKRLTAIVTAERGTNSLTRHGIEEYLADCVIVLNHLLDGAVSTRRLRVVKYRGSTHGTNEFPFLIDAGGVSVLPVTSLALKHVASRERISSGIPSLDRMLDGKGYYRGTSILLSGSAGVGKSTIAAHFIAAACRRGERGLYLAFEESVSQIGRNMHSVGIDFTRLLRSGRLRFEAMRPTAYGLEMHLVHMHRVVQEQRPSVVVIDPISSLGNAGAAPEVRSMMLRLIDSMKASQTTAFVTSLTHDGEYSPGGDSTISSVMDTWLVGRMIDVNGTRERHLSVIKARGIAHSNDDREFLITSRGVEITESHVHKETGP